MTNPAASRTAPEWILADAHAGASVESDRELDRLIDVAQTRGVDLLILGDLFRSWLAPPRFQTAFQRRLLGRFRDLRAAGRRVDFVVGNRDYFVEEGEAGGAFDEVFVEGLREVGGVPTWVVHGDQLNRHDRAYLAWRALSRSPPLRRMLDWLPEQVVVGRAEALERSLRSRGERYKTGDLPIEALLGLGRKAKAKGAARALCGHFHHDRVVDVADGVPVVIAPAWLDQRRVLEALPGGILRSIDPLQPG
jgi:UDP-2,3-diacylglucosamine pyrophosphatase LpxH